MVIAMVEITVMSCIQSIWDVHVIHATCCNSAFGTLSLFFFFPSIPFFIIHVMNRIPRLYQPWRRCFTTQQQPTTQHNRGKFRGFMKKYGPVGAGVYLALSVVDLSLTMGVISVTGADRVKKAEDWILQHVKGMVGVKHKRDPEQQVTTATHEKDPSWTSLFLVAYGIHKTLLLPVRLSLTAAITPSVARYMKHIKSKR